MTVRDAIAWIKSPPPYQQVDGGKPGLCLKNVRIAFGIPSKYGTAAQAALHTTLSAGAKRGSAPINRPYFWSGGSHGYGHIAITAGYSSMGNLMVWTTDWPNPVTGHADGKWRKVKVSTISARWGLHALGWGDSLNGVSIDV